MRFGRADTVTYPHVTDADSGRISPRMVSPPTTGRATFLNPPMMAGGPETSSWKYIDAQTLG